jgi:phage-related protein
VFYCTVVQRRIVMLHACIKRSQKTPKRDLDIAKRRLQEVLRHDTRCIETHVTAKTSGACRL